MNLGGYTATGPRDANEDSFYFLDFPDVRSFTNGITSFIMVSDGMGGYQGGDVASGLAVASAENYIDQLLDIADGNQIDFDAPYALGEIAQNAHDAILEETRERGSANMGATFIGAFLSPTHAWIGHVGDSRAYLIRDGEATQLTEDHSQVGRMLSRGLITEEEAQNHPARNRIERALGFSSDATPDINEVDLLPGDALLLCSDGVYTVLNSQAIAACISGAKNAEDAATRAVKSALRANTDDNSTAVVALNAQGGQPAKRKPMPTIRTDAVALPKHGSNQQHRNANTQGASQGRSRAGQHQAHANSESAQQYRIENYRGRSSLASHNSAAKPSVRQRGSSVASTRKPTKSLVIPLAVAIVLTIAVVVAVVVVGGNGGASSDSTTSQQQEPSTAPVQQNAPAAETPSIQTVATTQEYVVNEEAELKYIDQNGKAHTFTENNDALRDVNSITVKEPVSLMVGEHVQAETEPDSYGQEASQSYRALGIQYKKDLINDLESYINDQLQFDSSLAHAVGSNNQYVEFLRELKEFEDNLSEEGQSKKVSSIVKQLAVNASLLTPEQEY